MGQTSKASENVDLFALRESLHMSLPERPLHNHQLRHLQ